MHSIPGWLVIVASATFFLTGTPAARAAAGGEVRGAWVDRSSLTSREEIRATMQNLASGNFNCAFINVWSRGYTLWPSAVFERETGILIDPAYEGRDPLQEAIEEGKEAGIAVIPWVEYGFVGGFSGYRPGPGGKGPIFERHPDWLARNRAGSDVFPIAGGGNYFWMIHTHPGVQAFFFDLMMELAANYEVQAIEFDRARYPSLDCGYDETTRRLYADDHNGQPPPDRIDDPEWLRWRAEKLNRFVAELRSRIRSADWRMLVTNAPIVYRFGYVNFAQEYPVWVREGAVDFVSPQVYRRTLADYTAELDRQIAALPETRWLVPGVDITNSKDPEVLAQMIEATRARGLPGVVVWYYRELANLGAFEKLRQTVYQSKAPLPWR